MEPLPETRHAVEEFGPFAAGDADLLEELGRSAERVRAVVPECVGITLAMVSEGLAFTVVATGVDVAAMDGLQYLDGGPCVAAADRGRVVTHKTGDPTDEESWSTFARGTAAHGVASTLTLPLLSHGQVHGSVNLYASTPSAFEGHHDEIAEIFGAWAPGAVTNADLSLETVRTARRAPAILREQVTVTRAVGMLMVRDGIDADTARDRLSDAAARAGVDLPDFADVVLESRPPGESGR